MIPSLLIASVFQLEIQFVDVPEKQFVEIIRNAGYKVEVNKELNQMAVQSDTDRIILAIRSSRNDGKSRTITGVDCVSTFVSPKCIDSLYLLKWRRNSGFLRVSAESNLDGSSRLSYPLLGSNGEANGFLPSLNYFVNAVRRFKVDIKPYLAMEAPLYAKGSAPLDLDARRIYITSGDIEYLRDNFNWGKRVYSSVFDMLGFEIRPKGLRAVLACYPRGAPYRTEIRCAAKLSPSQLDKVRRKASDANWPEFYLQEGYAYAEREIIQNDSMTVREIKQFVEDFVEKFYKTISD